MIGFARHPTTDVEPMCSIRDPGKRGSSRLRILRNSRGHSGSYSTTRTEPGRNPTWAVGLALAATRKEEGIPTHSFERIVEWRCLEPTARDAPGSPAGPPWGKRSGPPYVVLFARRRARTVGARRHAVLRLLGRGHVVGPLQRSIDRRSSRSLSIGPLHPVSGSYRASGWPSSPGNRNR